MKPSYEKGQEKTRKTEVGDQSLGDKQKNGRKDGMGEESGFASGYAGPRESGVRIQKTGDRSLNAGTWILDSGFWMLATGS